MNLVVPADFTTASRAAAGYASRIAEKTGAGMVLLHVYSPPVSRNSPVWPLDAEAARIISRETDQRMAQYFSDCLRSRSIRCKGKTRVGRLTDEIVMEAAEDSPSMIVMATSADCLMHAIFRESNTSGVIESTRSPVLVLPDGIQPRVPKKVTFATDCQPSDLDAMQGLASLCRKLNAELVVVHVNTFDEHRTHPSVEEFAWRARDLTGFDDISCHTVAAGNVPDGLTDYISMHHTDLMAFTLRKTSPWDQVFKRSLAEKILSRVRLPLLLYPSRVHP